MMKKFNLYITFLDKVYIIESKIRIIPCYKVKPIPGHVQGALRSRASNLWGASIICRGMSIIIVM